MWLHEAIKFSLQRTADGGRNPCTLGVRLSASFTGEVWGRRKERRQKDLLGLCCFMARMRGYFLGDFVKLNKTKLIGTLDSLRKDKFSMLCFIIMLMFIWASVYKPFTKFNIYL